MAGGRIPFNPKRRKLRNVLAAIQSHSFLAALQLLPGVSSHGWMPEPFRSPHPAAEDFRCSIAWLRFAAAPYTNNQKRIALDQMMASDSGPGVGLLTESKLFSQSNRRRQGQAVRFDFGLHAFGMKDF